MPAEPRAVKVQPMEYPYDPDSSPAPSDRTSERLRGGDDTDLRFRCAGTIPRFSPEQEQQQYPIRLDTLSPMPRAVGGGSVDSWWQSDLLYRKYFDQGPRVVDEKVVQDYIYQDFSSRRIALGLPSSATSITSNLLGNSHHDAPFLPSASVMPQRK